jgi:hypothetical protein
MAIAFDAAGAEATANAGNNLTLAAPASPANDDVWVAVIHHNNHGATPSFTDWTTIGDYDDGSGNLLSLWYFRYAGSTPNLVYGSTANGRIGAIASFSGCKTSGSPVNVLGAGANGSDASAEHTATTTTADNCMVLYIAAIAGAGGDIDILPTGTAAAFEDSGGGTQNCYAATQGAIGVSYKLQASAGGTGSLTSTFTAAVAWVTRTVALEPDTGSGQPAAKRMGGVQFTGDYRSGGGFKLWRNLLIPDRGLVYG